MSATTPRLLAAMATTLKANLNGVDTFTYFPPNFNPPIAVCWPSLVKYHGAFGDTSANHDIVVALFLAVKDEKSMMGEIAEFLSYDGTNSVREALEADITLGNVVSDVSCVDGRVAAIVQAGEAQYMRLDFNVQVIA